MSEQVGLTVLLIGLVGAMGLLALRFTSASYSYDGATVRKVARPSAKSRIGLNLCRYGLALLLSVGSGVAPVWADSPLTSTDIHGAYGDIPIVAQAKAQALLSPEVAAYLAAPSNPIDVKAAVINALSWSSEGKHNAELFRFYLQLLHQQDGRSWSPLRLSDQLPADLELDLHRLSAEELFCLGYLTVLDDYFHPAQGLPLLARAVVLRPDSVTIAIVHALAQAQVAMETNWCRMWQVTDAVLRNDRLTPDLRPEALKQIVDYMVNYRRYCR